MIRTGILGVLLWMLIPSAQAIDCSSVLPGPAQSYAADGTLYMQTGARITNYSALDLCFATVTGYDYEMNDLACGSGKCQITKIPSASRTRPIIPTSPDSGYYTVATWTTPSVILGSTAGYGSRNASDSNRWDIGTLEVNGPKASASFSNNYSTYVTKSLVFYNNGTLTLTAGKTYIVDGSVFLSQGTINIVGVEPTTLYVNGDFRLDNTAVFTGMSSLDVYVTGALNMSGNTQTQGAYYVEGNATLTNNATLTGRLAAKNVYLMGNSQIIYDSTPALSCYSDDFNRSALGSDWIYKALGSSLPPYINSNRLNVTQDIGNQASSITYQKLFPGQSNLVQVEFNYFAWSKNSGTGGDGLAIILSDATITPQPGSYGGALGYAQRNNGTPGFAGGWIGVGLDEYGNFSSANEGKVGGPGVRAQAIAIRGSAKSNYKYLTGTAANLSPTIDKRATTSAAPNHKYRLTVDSRSSGKAMVSLERDVKDGNGYQTLISPFDAVAITGQGAVPDNFYLSLTGSTGGSYNNHELDDFKVCALKSSPVGTQIDHFEFDVSGNPLTCAPQTMTVRACANAACSSLITDKVTATLSPASLADGGWVGGNVVTLTNGTGSLTLAKRTTGTVTLGVTASSPSTKPQSTTLCRVGNSGSLTAGACTLDFQDSALLFDVPAKLANKPATGITLRAVRKSDSADLCVPAFAGQTRNIAFWSSYVTPASTVNPSQPAVTVNNTSVGFSEATRTSVPLTFDSSGQATLSVNYADAGEMQLDARYTGSTATGDDTLVINGSDKFVSAPAGLCIQPEATCSAANASCPAFRRAGEDFSVKISARAWQQDNDTDLCTGNGLTPNFALSGIALGSQLLAPQGGTNAAVTTASYDHIANASGEMSLTQTLSEVGVFALTATPPSYLGMTLPVASSAPVGRFTPYDYLIQNPALQAACAASGFSYMDQPFAISYNAVARNKRGQTTTNYDSTLANGAFIRDNTTLVAENADNGVALDGRLSAITAPWSQGRQNLSLYPVSFGRLAANQPDGPYASLAVGVRLTGTDQLSVPLSNADMHSASAGACGSNCNALKLGSQQLRLGRLNAGSGRAAPSSALAVPLQFEYFTGSGWALNALDSCSRLDLQTAGAFVFDRPYAATTRELTLASNAKSQLALSSSRTVPGTAASQQASAGYLWLHFSAPGVNDRVSYGVDLSKQPAAPVWLRFDWNGDGTAANNEASGWAYFNQWRGSDRIIYRREKS